MRLAVIDSNVLIGARVSDDQYHDRARELLRAFDHREIPKGVVVSSVLEETLNLIQVGTSVENAVKTLDGIQESSGLETRHVTKNDIAGGRRRFRLYDELSLTDSIIVAWMERNEIEYLYSFDDDFDAVDGVTRLDTAHDPY